MPSSELVSVVIPAFNAEKYLADAIHSVRAQLWASLGLEAEIIVVDDGSTDRTGDVARSFSGVRCLCQLNGGIAAARNAGIKHARGTLLAFVDADDVWTADKLALQIGVLRAQPEAYVTGGVEQFYDLSLVATSQPPAAIATACAGTTLIRTADFLRVGLFNPALRIGEFIDWYSRASAIGLREHRLDATVLRRRIHGANTTFRQRGSSVDYVAVLKAHLDRKRLAA